MYNLQCFLFKMRLRIFVYISAEHKRNAVFNAFFGHVTELPHLIFIKIVDKDTVTVRQKLSVNLSAAYDKSIVTAVLFNYRFYIVNNLRTVALKIFIGCKYNVFSIFKRFCVRKTLQRLSAHNNRLTHCFLFKKFHILGYAEQQIHTFAYAPLFINRRNYFHSVSSGNINSCAYGSVLAQSMNDFDHSVNL